MPLPTDRTTANTAAEHVADHNTLHTQHNTLEGHPDASDPHSAASYAIMVGGGRRLSVQSSAPSSPSVGDLWADTREPNPQFVRKTADETVTNSATLQNDDHLTLALKANGVYVIQGLVGYAVAENADIQIGWTFPAGASWLLNTWGPAPAIAASATPTGSVQFDSTRAGTSSVTLGGVDATNQGTPFRKVPAVIQGTLVMGGSDGNLQLQWAQATAVGATSAIVFTNSYLIAIRVNV